MKQKLALVQWIGGKYDKTYTPGVPVDWILDFNPKKFDPAKEPEDHSYVVQWRENKSGKVSKCGWNFYDAKIIRVSSKYKLFTKLTFNEQLFTCGKVTMDRICY